MNWDSKDGQLIKEFKFEDFKSALEFVNEVGKLAEQSNHHPDIELSWGKVVIKLTTHSEGKVTNKDYDLAAKIDQLKT